MSVISFSGLVTGLDTGSWVSALTALRNAKVEQLEEEKSAVVALKDVVSGIKSYFTSFRSALERLTDAKFGTDSMDLFVQNLANSSNPGKVTATATPSAARDTYEVGVTQVASNTKVNTAVRRTVTVTNTAAATTKLSVLGVETGYVSLNNREIEIGNSDTIETLVNKLSDIGITAYYEEDKGRFTIATNIFEADDGTTKLFDSLGLEFKTVDGFESDRLMTEGYVTIKPTTLLSDIGVQNGAININQQQVNLNFGAGATVQTFLDYINDNYAASGASASMDADGFITISGIDIKEIDGGSNIITALGLVEKVDSVTSSTGGLSYIKTDVITENSKLGDINTSFSNYSLVLNNGSSSKSVNFSASSTLGEVFNQIEAYAAQNGMNADISIDADGIISITGDIDKLYLSGGVIDGLGLTPEKVNGTDMTSSALKYTSTLTASTSTTFGELGISGSDLSYSVLNKRAEVVQNGLAVSENTTIEQWFNSLKQYGITGSISDEGVISIDGDGLISGKLATALGLSYVESGSEISGTVAESNILQGTKTQIASATSTLASLGLNGNYSLSITAGGATTTKNFNANSTLGDFQAAIEAAGGSFSISDTGYVEISGIEKLSGSLISALKLTEETVDGTNLVTGNLTYTIHYTATESTTLADLGLGASSLIISNQYGEALATQNLSATTSLGDIANTLGAYGLTMSINNGVISIEGDGVISGSFADAVGIKKVQSGTQVMVTEQTSSKLYASSVTSATLDSTLASMGFNGSYSLTIDGKNYSLNGNSTLNDVKNYITSNGGEFYLGEGGEVDIIGTGVSGSLLTALGFTPTTVNGTTINSANLQYESGAIADENSRFSDYGVNVAGKVFNVLDTFGNTIAANQTLAANATVADLISQLKAYGLDASISPDGQISISNGVINGSLADALGITTSAYMTVVNSQTLISKSITAKVSTTASLETTLSDLGISGTQYLTINHNGTVTGFNFSGNSTLADIQDAVTSAGGEFTLQDGYVAISGVALSGSLSSNLGLNLNQGSIVTNVTERIDFTVHTYTITTTATATAITTSTAMITVTSIATTTAVSTQTLTVTTTSTAISTQTLTVTTTSTAISTQTLTVTTTATAIATVTSIVTATAVATVTSIATATAVVTVTSGSTTTNVIVSTQIITNTITNTITNVTTKTEVVTFTNPTTSTEILTQTSYTTNTIVTSQTITNAASSTETIYHTSYTTTTNITTQTITNTTTFTSMLIHTADLNTTFGELCPDKSSFTFYIETTGGVHEVGGEPSVRTLATIVTSADDTIGDFIYKVNSASPSLFERPTLVLTSTNSSDDMPGIMTMANLDTPEDPIDPIGPSVPVTNGRDPTSPSLTILSKDTWTMKANCTGNGAIISFSLTENGGLYGDTNIQITGDFTEVFGSYTLDNKTTIISTTTGGTTFTTKVITTTDLSSSTVSNAGNFGVSGGDAAGSSDLLISSSTETISIGNYTLKNTSTGQSFVFNVSSDTKIIDFVSFLSSTGLSVLFVKGSGNNVGIGDDDLGSSSGGTSTIQPGGGFVGITKPLSYIKISGNLGNYDWDGFGALGDIVINGAVGKTVKKTTITTATSASAILSGQVSTIILDRPPTITEIKETESTTYDTIYSTTTSTQTNVTTQTITHNTSSTQTLYTTTTYTQTNVTTQTITHNGSTTEIQTIYTDVTSRVTTTMRTTSTLVNTQTVVEHNTEAATKTITTTSSSTAVRTVTSTQTVRATVTTVTTKTNIQSKTVTTITTNTNVQSKTVTVITTNTNIQSKTVTTTATTTVVKTDTDITTMTSIRTTTEKTTSTYIEQITVQVTLTDTETMAYRSDQKTYTTTSTTFSTPDTLLSQIGVSNGTVNKVSGGSSSAIFTVTSTSTLSNFIVALNKNGFNAEFTNGRLVITSNDDSTISGGSSNLVSALGLSTITASATYYQNSTSNVFDNRKTTPLTGTTKLEDFLPTLSDRILNVNTTNGNLSHTFAASDTLDDVISYLNSIGINSSISNGKFSAAAELFEFSLSGTLAEYLLGENPSFTTTTATSAWSATLPESINTVPINGTTKLVYLGITEGTIKIYDNGNYISRVFNVNADTTIDDLFTALDSYGIQAELKNGQIYLSADSDMYIMNETSDLVTKLGFTINKDINTVFTSTTSKTLEYDTVYTITSSTTMADLGFNNNAELRLTVDGVIYSLAFGNNETVQNVLDTLAVYGIDASIDSNGKLSANADLHDFKLGGELGNILTSNSANYTNFDTVTGYHGQMNESVTDVVINNDTKLVDLEVSTGAIKVYDNGTWINTAISINENTSIGDLINALAGYGLDAKLENGKLVISSDSDKYITDESSNLVSKLGLTTRTQDSAKLYDQTNSKTLTVVTTHTTDETTTLRDLGLGSGASLRVEIDGVVQTIGFSADENVGDIIDALGALGIDAEINNGTLSATSTDATFKLTGTLASYITGNAPTYITTEKVVSYISPAHTDDVKYIANGSTKITDLGVSAGYINLLKDGEIITSIAIEDNTTISQFFSALSPYGVAANINSNGEITIQSIGDITLKDGTSNLVSAWGLDDNIVKATYHGTTEVLEDEVYVATEDTLASYFDTADSKAKGSLYISVYDQDGNLSNSVINIEEDDTLGDVLEKFQNIGVTAYMQDGVITIHNGLGKVEVTGGSSNLIDNLKIQANGVEQWMQNDDPITVVSDEIRYLSIVNYADNSTTLETLDVTSGDFSIGVNGAIVNVYVDSTDTLQNVISRISSATNGSVTASLTSDGRFTLEAADGVELLIGTSTDTTNIATIFNLTSNGTNKITGETSLYKASAASKITQSGIFRLGDVTEGTFTIGNAEFTITSETTIASLVNEINRNEAANATVYWDNINGKMVITSNSLGASYVNIQSGTSNIAEIFGLVTFDDNGVERLATYNQALGNNAIVTINGTRIVATSNTITSDVSRIEGLTVNIKDVTEGEYVTITVERDTQGIIDAVQETLDAYNTLISELTSALSISGDLHGDTALNGLKNQITSMLTSKGTNGTTKFRNLAAVGISTEGASSAMTADIYSLYLDTEKFTNALNESENDVKLLLVGTVDNPGIFTRVENLVEEMLSTGGYFTTKNNAINRDIANYDNQIAKASAKVDFYKSMLENKFSNMELLYSNMKSNYSNFISGSIV